MIGKQRYGSTFVSYKIDASIRMRLRFVKIDFIMSLTIYHIISCPIFWVNFLLKAAFSKACFDNFSRSIYYVPRSINS